MAPAPDPATRRVAAPENLALLLAGTLLAGLLLGLAIGRRQGLTLNTVQLPPDAMNQSQSGGDSAADDEAMRASAPKAPTTYEEARAMVDAMGDTPVDELISLGDRKFGNGKHYLAAAFYAKALEQDPAHPRAWLNLAQAFDAIGDKDKAQEAYRQCLAHNPDAESAATAKKALK
jgi:tetratricopeptide (TPR) repeat protein